MKELLFKKALVNVVLFVIALIMLGVGSGMILIPETAKRDDVRLFNQAVTIYNQEDYITTGDTPSVSYTPDNLLLSIEYFQEAADKSKDNQLKSLAYYNIGTAIVRDYLYSSEERLDEYRLSAAISFFKEAIRLAPDNEDAKYNLEYIEHFGE